MLLPLRPSGFLTFTVDSTPSLPPRTYAAGTRWSRRLGIHLFVFSFSSCRISRFHYDECPTISLELKTFARTLWNSAELQGKVVPGPCPFESSPASSTSS